MNNYLAMNDYFANIGNSLADKHDKGFNKFKDYLETAVKESIDLTSTVLHIH